MLIFTRMIKKYNISQEYFDGLLEIFLNGFKDGDTCFEDQRTDTDLLDKMLKRLVKLERWEDADFIRDMLGQDPVGVPDKT